MDNKLNVRLQHAVEHDEVVEGLTIQKPALSSIPKDGEIVFNRDRTNFKVGDGNTIYDRLNNFNKTITVASGSDIDVVGTPEVTVNTSGDTTTFTFHKLKGAQGESGLMAQADWAETDSSADSYIQNKPTLFSGNYNDLSNKPTIPIVNNGVLTIQQDGVSIGTFTANQRSNSTINITTSLTEKPWYWYNGSSDTLYNILENLFAGQTPTLVISNYRGIIIPYDNITPDSLNYGRYFYLYTGISTIPTCFNSLTCGQEFTIIVCKNETVSSTPDTTYDPIIKCPYRGGTIISSTLPSHDNDNFYYLFLGNDDYVSDDNGHYLHIMYIAITLTKTSDSSTFMIKQ